MPRSTGTRYGWVRSARLAFEKSAGRATASRPNLPYTRTNKRLHLALKKHADRRFREEGEEEESRGKGGRWVRYGQTDAGYSHLRGRTAGHAVLFHDAHARARPHVHAHVLVPKVVREGDE